MKLGYTVETKLSIGDKFIEVVNYKNSNTVLNMGWIYYETPCKLKDENTVGIWKIKHQKI